jgi:Zn-dependent M28 family amino/carboxypeptidase
MIADLTLLAHDSLEGRRIGTAGAERARNFLVKAFEERGVAPVNGQRLRSFEFSGRGATTPQTGVNVLGVVPGTVSPQRYVVVTAHYDHLGVRDGQVYNGADDNASGTAAILALSAWLAQHPPRNSFVFAALDGEETGLRGARAFVAEPPVPLGCVVMNVNLDMVSRSAKNELYAAGTYHHPVFAPQVAEVAAMSKISLLAGHDRPDLPPGDDWTQSSDHGPFHQAGVPFIYFGVEDHPGYHRATDDAQDITPAFYVEAIETVLDFLLVADRSADQILRATNRQPPATCPRP